MAFDPKAVASTSARKISGAELARFRPVIVPFTSWLASGVRRPFIQSTARMVLSLTGTLAASSERAGMILPAVSSISFALVSASIRLLLDRMFSSGQANTFLNQA